MSQYSGKVERAPTSASEGVEVGLYSWVKLLEHLASQQIEGIFVLVRWQEARWGAGHGLTLNFTTFMFSRKRKGT